MKLTNMEKMDRKIFKDMMTAKNGKVFTYEAFGITVVTVPACGRSDSEYVHVAVAQRSESDTFKRKRGELVALERWANGNVVSVRSRGRCLADVAQDTVGFLTM